MDAFARPADDDEVADVVGGTDVDHAAVGSRPAAQRPVLEAAPGGARTTTAEQPVLKTDRGTSNPSRSSGVDGHTDHDVGDVMVAKVDNHLNGSYRASREAARGQQQPTPDTDEEQHQQRHKPRATRALQQPEFSEQVALDPRLETSSPGESPDPRCSRCARREEASPLFSEASHGGAAGKREERRRFLRTTPAENVAAQITVEDLAPLEPDQAAGAWGAR